MPVAEMNSSTLKRMKSLLLILCVSLLSACSEDPMEVCLRTEMERQSPAEGAGRGQYIQAREKIRQECARKLGKE